MKGTAMFRRFTRVIDTMPGLIGFSLLLSSLYPLTIWLLIR